jgi:hypothetical protein
MTSTTPAHIAAARRRAAADEWPVLSEAVITAGKGDLYAVEWQPNDEFRVAGGQELMLDWDGAGHESAEFLLRHYAQWPGRIVRRTVTVGPWQPVDAEAAQ